MTKVKSIKQFCPIRRVGKDTYNHFFGYYNKNIWDKTGRFLLSQRVTMLTGDLTGKEVAEVGFFDLECDDVYRVIGDTSSWNWQMGCQLQWLGNNENWQIIYNTRKQSSTKIDTGYSDFCSTLYNIESNENKELPLPIYVVSPNSKYALCVDYSRFQVTHPTIGYHATKLEPNLENAPENDGIYRLEIDTGEVELILSLCDLREFQPVASMDRAIHWVTHLEINPNSSRFLFIHRWTERVEDETCFLHRLFTVKSDGSDLKLLECTDHPLPQLADSFDRNKFGTFDYEKSEHQISHPIWKDDRQIIVWGPHLGSIHYHLYDNLSGRAKVIGENLLTENGHMSFSPNKEWILSDTYPDESTNERLLILYDVKNDCRYDIGSFYTDPNLGKHNRCDLHPRWNLNGREVCIDSVHELTRQIYIIDVSSITCN